MTNALITHNFKVKYLPFLGPPPNHSLFISRFWSILSIPDIFETNNLLCIKVSVEAHKSSGPSQCFTCHRVTRSQFTKLWPRSKVCKVQRQPFLSQMSKNSRGFNNLIQLWRYPYRKLL